MMMILIYRIGRFGPVGILVDNGTRFGFRYTVFNTAEMLELHPDPCCI